MTTNNALRELAEKATPGPWTTDSDVVVIAAGSDQLNNGYGICECHGPESRQNVDFIAAANPATILALLDENEALQAECEKLRKDAEATRKSVKLLNYLFARNIIAMQSAVIEWEKGKGAAAGMQWIWNTLFGPGQIPDEEETDAQAYFDREIEPLDAVMETTK